jgi:hypothetical protein
MNTLTAAIAVPQIGNMRVVRVAPDVDDSAVYVSVQVRSAAGLPYPSVGTIYNLTIRDGAGLAQGIRANGSAAAFNDRVEVFAHATYATGLTDVVAANVGASMVVRNKAVETALTAAGLLPPGVVT